MVVSSWSCRKTFLATVQKEHKNVRYYCGESKARRHSNDKTAKSHTSIKLKENGKKTDYA